MANYTEVYRTWAVNQSPAAMVAALAAAPLNSDVRTTLGLVPFSDVTASSGVRITRTIESNDGTGTQPLAHPQPAAVLTNLETINFARALATQVVADPVVVA